MSVLIIPLHYESTDLSTLYLVSLVVVSILTSNNALGQPVDNRDSSLKVETVLSGLNFPTTMTFLGPDDILVLEKNQGTVQRIVNGQMLEEPILDVNVANEVERGMLGIAVANNDRNNSSNNNDTPYVFLYYTEAYEEDGGEPIGNRLYRYELVDNKLVNPKLLLDLPYQPGPAHNGGVIAIGPDNNVYVLVGNLYSPAFNKGGESNLIQNTREGEEPDGRGGILRVSQDGQPVGNGILGVEHPLDMYYAYGIRNSFGMDFDPLTGKLWDTENGGNDEINLVEPGFNSGWNEVSGMSFLDNDFDEKNLVDFEGKGKYSDPELDLGEHIAPTAITFLHSDRLGTQYESQMFVANAHGELFNFELNGNRTGLLLTGTLGDKVSEDMDDLEDVTFGEEFGLVTDLEVGPDGYLYGISHAKNGEIFRIVPVT